MKTTVQEISQNVEVRIAVHDSKRNFLGYKADSCWTLNRSFFKRQSFKNGKLDPPLIKGLIYLLNEIEPKAGLLSLDSRRWFDKDTSFNLVVEQIDSEGNLVNKLMNYKVYRDTNGEYNSEGPIVN